jgi:hypothetical protein
MAESSRIHPLTRLVRAAALFAAQGASIGFALDTVRMWSRLPDFATTNKIAASERMQLVVWLVLPAAVWGAFSLAWAVLRSDTWSRRLDALEHSAWRHSWVIGMGLLPVLMHPTLWQSRALPFLVATGTASLVAWGAFRVSQKVAKRETTFVAQLKCAGQYAASLLPMRLKVLAPLGVIGLVVLYAMVRGVWLEGELASQRSGDHVVVAQSLRHAFSILGHGGWLGLPIVLVEFLRPPSHAHVVFWSLCVGLSAFPLYFWARNRLGVPMALAVALIYLSMPLLRTIGRTELLPLGVAAGAFFLAVLEWERKRISLAIVLTLLAVGIHEQAALWFACFGIHMSLSPRTAQLGRWLTTASCAYFIVVAFVVLPFLELDLYQTAFKGLWGSKSVGLYETIRVALTNPAYVLSRWFELQGLAFWLTLFVPFAFLPMAARDWLLWMVPGVVLSIAAAGRCPTLPAAWGSLAHFVVLGFAASVTTLSRLKGEPRTRRHANAAAMAWVFAAIPSVYQLGGLWLPAL